MNNRKIWPKVLFALSESGRPLTAVQIGQALNIQPESAYGAMSSMGNYMKRHWIKPVGSWDRTSPFQVTEDGRDALSTWAKRRLRG